MEKLPSCISREEQDSLRALAGTVEETLELSHSLYKAVMNSRDSLRVPPLPVFAEHAEMKDE